MANQVSFRKTQQIKRVILIALDTLKGSYYANPVIDVPSVSDDIRKDYPEYYGSNICRFMNSYHS